MSSLDRGARGRAGQSGAAAHGGLIEPERAFGLTLGMARVAGVALARAAGSGGVSRRELAGMVACCQACAFAAECQRFLAQPGATAPPGFCAIGSRLLVLAGRAPGPWAAR
ncbi:MAG: DUF6455 family protein [Gemmobacter sp.]|uniref:DUF6455 family protein n=1 Tax=Gemmobacter sp. TaxID=1898957 RepID=UPI00391C3527